MKQFISLCHQVFFAIRFVGKREFAKMLMLNTLTEEGKVLQDKNSHWYSPTTKMGDALHNLYIAALKHYEVGHNKIHHAY